MPYKLRGWHTGGRSVLTQRVGKRCYHENLNGRPEYHITSRDKRGPERERKDRLKTTTRRHVTLVSVLAPDCPRFRDRRKPKITRLAKAEKRGEPEMFRYLEVALYQSRKSRKRRRKDRRGFTTDLQLVSCVMQAQPSLTLFLSLSLSLSIYIYIYIYISIIHFV